MNFPEIIGQSPAMQEVFALMQKVIESDSTVLILGESGTGKEMVARAIHERGARWAFPLVTVNCGAIPEGLLESELFGHARGSFTGAIENHRGKFEVANHGTLFLDEIGNLPLAGQMKLLRVLETGRFERLGSNKERQVKVRVISATNADLASMIKAGSFREDLYYRLNVIQLNLPPLAERPDDIVPLALSFLEAGKSLSASAQQSLQAHSWPGNVRELKNVMQRACLLSAQDDIQSGDLGLPVAVHVVPSLEAEPDRAAIESALAKAHGVVAQAALDLGLSRQALYRRMERLNISR